VWTRARERAALSNSAFTSLGRSAAIFPPDSTLGFHPGEPICSACVEAAAGATPGDAASGRQEEAAKDDLTDADFIIDDDYFITDDDVVDDEEPTRQDDEDDLF